MGIKKFVLIFLLLILSVITISIFVFRSEFYYLKNFISPDLSKIKNDNGRVSVLVMGIAGKDHAGGDLTDTMILISFSLNKPSIVMISIPRDIWIPEIRAKINSSYHYGGLALTKTNTEIALGIPIHYGVVINFSGFKDVVDVLGGINVNVESEFTDNLYPIAGRENDLCDGDKTFRCRYETIHFSQGLQLMNGETALKYVRSRHADGIEGTDVAREARQQKVISAIENKAIDPKIFLNIKKDLVIWKVVMSSIETDINGESGSILARKAFDSMSSITKYIIPENILVNPPTSSKFDNQYVFVPKLGSGKWEEVHNWVKSIVN